MPAVVIYKPENPNGVRPVETSASIDKDGVITASATFLGPSVYKIGQGILPVFFPSLNSVFVQGLFVQSKTLEKRNGILMERMGVIGVINPPVVRKTVDVVTRRLSKSKTETRNEVTTTYVLDFDYTAEVIKFSFVYVLPDGSGNGGLPSIPRAIPKIIRTFNTRAPGGGGLTYRQTEYESENTTVENNIVRAERIYEAFLE